MKGGKAKVFFGVGGENRLSTFALYYIDICRDIYVSVQITDYLSPFYMNPTS